MAKKGEEERELLAVIAERLRTARLQSALSQEVVAARAGMTRSSLTNIELGTQRVTIYRLVILCSVLGVRVSDIVPEVGTY